MTLQDYLPYLLSESENLNVFKEIPLTTDNVEKYKKLHDTEHLHRIRTYPTYKDYFGSLFIDNNDHVVGYVNVNKNDGMIQALEISPKYRGSGLSKQLLKHAESKYKARQLTVNKKNSIALHVYQSSGWRIKGETPSGVSYLMVKS